MTFLINSPPLSAIDKALPLKGPNPFDIPPDSEMLEKRDKENEQLAILHRKMVKTKLMDRSFSSLPPLQAHSRRAARSQIDNSNGMNVQPPAAEHQQRQQMHEFIDQKREIFLVQLLIDRKNKEIQRIQNTRQAEKNNIVEEGNKIAEISNQYKMTQNQIEAELQREKKTLDQAIKRRTDLQKELKKKTVFVDAVSSEIARNWETLKSYQTYRDFLACFVSKDKPTKNDVMEYFQIPQTLMDEIEKVENENLFLLHHCQELTNEQEAARENISGAIDHAQGESDVIQNSMNKLKDVKEIVYNVHDSVDAETKALEVQVNKLAKIVTLTYDECFNESADVNTLTRLERIEIEFEEMYLQASQISESFIIQKQSEKDKKRREEQRKAKNEELQKEQARKHKQALLRAQMPLKRKVGRPCNERTLPNRLNRNQIDQKQKLLEEAAQDHFLYGEISD
ncbi:hypothetical protein TRFO_26630 [Tritrichomonas foetus]|uniref:DUF4200 domain-containing protein n=1 Tax=Tritrichomonas foetus TaxID=1144522 RepID=A0A1J4K2Y9_9EUKA|nr:hypothetical protein TRFO_26630 [Tritrichomonas foetus]|eukprot:OHT05563.1 hypothetical protein TRFO_26630 [Tritrichomonas foetus]